MKAEIITTATEFSHEDFTPGEIEYIRREAAYAAETSVRKTIVLLRELRHAEQKVRKAQQTEEGKTGGGPWVQGGNLAQQAVSRSFGEPGIPYTDSDTPYTRIETPAQAKSPQAEKHPVYGCNNNPCKYHGEW